MEQLAEYKVFAIPMTEVWVDPTFNHRQRFDSESVHTLAQSIKADGLTTPVVVQPWSEHPIYVFRLIAGFRRFAACRLLCWETIPAFITEIDISEFEAHKLNFIENLERKDLNIMEEAQGIRQLFPQGETPGEIARELNRPRQWVYRRLGLLELPYEVQLMLASGRLTQRDLDALLPLRNEHALALKAAERLLEAHSKGGEELQIVQRQLQRGKRVMDRRRTKTQIAEAIKFMFEMGIDGLPTRVAAWCAGTISTEMLKNDIKKWRESRK